MKKNKCWAMGIYVLALVCFLYAEPINADSGKIAQSRQVAEKLGQILAGTDGINNFSLIYEIELDCDIMVRLKTEVTLEMRLKEDLVGGRTGGGYVSSFTLVAPQAVGAWSWIAMNVLGGYEAEEYKDMVRSLNVRVEESFQLDGIFRTVDIRQILNEKNYANQTPIRLKFADGLIRFWQDAGSACEPRSLVFQGQAGPMTGFFNYVLHYRADEKFRVINVLNRVHDTGKVDPSTGLKIKAVEFIFRDELITIARNQEEKALFPFIISFADNNFLDIVQGKIVFGMFLVADRPEKIPYVIAVEGVLSRNKKFRQEQDIQALMDNKNELSAEEFANSWKKIKNRDILAARNIFCHLIKFNLNGNVYPP